MLGILFLFSIFFAFGLYNIIISKLQFPDKKAIKIIVNISKNEKKKTKNLELFIMNKAIKLSKYIRLNEYKSKNLAATLKSAGINLTPETYIAKAYVKAGLILLGIIPALLVFPIVSIVIAFLAILIYFKETRSAQEEVKKQREEIEFELPRFASTLTQEFKAGRDVTTILENYRKSAGESFGKELDTTISDMRSGNYENALTRLETRVGCSALSEIVRGLISVLHGDDGAVYFQMLSHDLKQLELQRLKTRAIKQPGKVKKYSFIMLAVFILTFLVVMGMQILQTMTNMF